MTGSDQGNTVFGVHYDDALSPPSLLFGGRVLCERFLPLPPRWAAQLEEAIWCQFWPGKHSGRHWHSRAGACSCTVKAESPCQPSQGIQGHAQALCGAVISYGNAPEMSQQWRISKASWHLKCFWSWLGVKAISIIKFLFCCRFLEAHCWVCLNYPIRTTAIPLILSLPWAWQEYIYKNTNKGIFNYWERL